MENYLWWRRSGVLIIIPVFFVLTITLLSLSVFYDQTIRVIHEYLSMRGVVSTIYSRCFQEISCSEDDAACKETLCPYGWTYVEHLNHCELQKGNYK